MDFLTHLTLPLTVAYVLEREVFESPRYLLLGVFGLLPDFDKFLGVPGLLHSAVGLAAVTLVLVGAERWWRGRLVVTPVVVALIWSHLVLDIVDGGPVPLLFPLIETGIGFRYPVQVAFGEGLLGVRLDGPLVALRSTAPAPGHNTYGFVQGAGVASALAFLTVYLGLHLDRSRARDRRVE